PRARVSDAVVPGPPHTRAHAEVAPSKPSARHTLEVGLTCDRAVEHGIADDDVLGRLAPRLCGLADDQPPARQALAGVVVGVAVKLQGNAVREESTKALPGIAAERRPDGVLRETAMAVAARDFAR